MDRSHHQGLGPEEHRRLSDLFDRLDVNKDGRIDVDDLTRALKKLQVPQVPNQARDLIAKYDSDLDGHIDFSDFVQFVLEHEQNLRLSFEKLDRNKDGVIDREELWHTLTSLGLHIERAEVDRLLKRLQVNWRMMARHKSCRMDQNQTLTINFNEFREYLLLHPYSDIADIVHYWRHATVIDIGEDSLIPDDFTERELQTGMWWRHLVSGAAAGAVSRTCTAPLDRLKVLLQVHSSVSNNITISSGFSSMLREGGVRSLWRGNGINVLKIAPETALKFAAYEQIKRIFKRNGAELGPLERFASGSLAGAISQSIIYPMEVLKTRLALRRTGQYSGICDCSVKIFQMEGPRSFYRGYLPNLIGIIPYAGIDLCIYETLKRFYMKHHGHGKDPSMLVVLLCGTTSSLCGQLASYPLALVRTKLQAKTVNDPKETMVGLFGRILNEEGPRGLYRGITPNFMKVAPAVSISYMVYETVRKLLGVEMS